MNGAPTSRRRWARWSIVPSLLVVGGATATLVRVGEVDRAAAAYDTAVTDPAGAAAAVAAYQQGWWPERLDGITRPLGLGAAQFVAGDLAAARAAFETAYDDGRGDRRCRADVNLVLTIEAQGDEIAELDPGAARRLYLEARAQVDADEDCRADRDDDGDGAGDRLDRAADRLDAKLASTTGPDSSEQRPVAPEQTETEPDQSDLDDLDRALDENADTRSQGPELEEGGGDVGIPLPHVPQW